MQSYQEICNFYKGKRVLITGHTGFKGSWLSFWLNSIGAKVIGYSLNPITDSCFFQLNKLSEKIIDYREDIRNLNTLEKVFELHNPEVIFHLAAQPIVIESYKKPVYTFETNIMGTVNLLEVFQKNKFSKVLIIITTDKVYKIDEKFKPFKESDLLEGYDPYSSSKVAVEIIAKSWFSSFNIDNKKSINTVRAGNVIGGGDWSENRIVPDLFRSLASNQKLIIRNPNSVRPWQHVLEPLLGYLMLGREMYISNKNSFKSWNFGPDEANEKTVKELVGAFQSLNSQLQIDFIQIDSYHETKILKLDSSKAKSLLKWKPLLSFDEMIKFTNDWYENISNSNTEKITMEQINYFTSKY